jgi:NAD(P)-dependent dehydrogenase (short-subunit alcohol dehydrogenase family)
MATIHEPPSGVCFFNGRARQCKAAYIHEQAQHWEIGMARVFITGSSDGLGLMVGQVLVDQGHQVALHARNDTRANDAKKALPKAEAVVVGDLASIAATKDLAAQVNAHGPFDAVIHNAAVGYREEQRATSDGVPHVFAINTLAPYILTMLINRPKRLIYLSSGMHERANANLDDIFWRKRRWDGSSAYAESKLHDVMLAFTVARLWPNVLSNAVTPGWVPTKMGGAGAPDDISQAHLTQAWLATSDDAEAKTTGGYFYHLKRREPNREAREISVQDRLIDICQEISGINMPWS